MADEISKTTRTVRDLLLGGNRRPDPPFVSVVDVNCKSIWMAKAIIVACITARIDDVFTEGITAARKKQKFPKEFVSTFRIR